MVSFKFLLKMYIIAPSFSLNNLFLEFISTLPVTLIAEANVLRERVASQQRQRAEGNNGAHIATRPTQQSEGQPVPPKGRRQRNGKLVSSDEVSAPRALALF